MAQREGALIRSMIALRGERKTGLLHVDANGVRTSMHLKEGIIVYADEAPSVEPLGRLLVRCGLLTAARYTEVLEKMADAAPNPDHLRFGEVSIECGFLTPEQLAKALGDHIRMRVIRAFHREDHEWKFEEARAGLTTESKPRPRIEIGIEPVVLLAARTFREMPDRELVPAASMHRVPLLVDDIAVITQRFELKPGERAFVETIDGTKRVCDLIPASTPNTIRMHQSAILAALLWTRAAKLADKSHMPSVRAPAAEPVPSADPPSSRSVLAAAAAPSSSSMAVATKKSDAPVAPARITHEARLNAELCFQKGRTHFGAGRTEEALQDFRQAQKLDPASHEYALYTGWLEAGAGKKEIDYAHRLSLKRDALALQRGNATMAFPLYVIGHIAMLEGSHTDAKRWLEQARALDPDMRDAEGALRALARKVSATSSDPMEGSATQKKAGSGDKSDKSASPAASSGLLGRVSGWLGRKND